MLENKVHIKWVASTIIMPSKEATGTVAHVEDQTSLLPQLTNSSKLFRMMERCKDGNLALKARTVFGEVEKFVP